MTLRVVADADAVTKEVVREGRALRVTPYHGKPKVMAPGPQSFMLESMEPRATVDPHFHSVNQFQIFWRGGIGGTHAEPGCVRVHYADAFASYGPITSPPDTGYRYLTVRSAADPGPQWMPEARDRHRGGRRFDLSVPVDDAPAGAPLVTTALGPMEDGLAVHLARLAPFEPMPQFGPSGGVHVLLLRGSLIVAETEYSAFADAYGEGGSTGIAAAGEGGCVALVLEFPIEVLANTSDRPDPSPGARNQ